MRVALGFNPVLTIADATKLAVDAESAGYDSLWMHESLYQRDVVTYISAMAGATSKIRIGSGVINTFTRHPVAAATTFASLSEMSNGRVNLGLGLGSFPTVPLIGHRIFPVAETRPLKRIKEYVEVIRLVWKGGKVNFDGEFFKVHDLALGFDAAGFEAYFRGTVQKRLAGRFGLPAIPAAATLDALLHIPAFYRYGEIAPLWVATTIVADIIWGLTFYFGRSLLASFTSHFAWDVAIFVVAPVY